MSNTALDATRKMGYSYHLPLMTTPGSSFRLSRLNLGRVGTPSETSPERSCRGAHGDEEGPTACQKEAVDTALEAGAILQSQPSIYLVRQSGGTVLGERLTAVRSCVSIWRIGAGRRSLNSVSYEQIGDRRLLRSKVKEEAKTRPES